MPHVTGATVFVRRLASDVDNEALETAFSDAGPVQRAFVVRDKETGDSRGFGFVQFALEDDATNAISMLNNRTMNGRKIQVSRASRPGEHVEEPMDKEDTSISHSTNVIDEAKHQAFDVTSTHAPTDTVQSTTEYKNDVQSKNTTKSPKKEIKPQTISPEQDVLRRTVVIFGLPVTMEANVLRKRVRKLGAIESLKWPIEGYGKEPESKAIAHIVYKKRADCLKATKKLQDHQIHGAKMHARHGDEVESYSTGKRRSRVIIRNLAFQATEQDLRNICQPIGPLVDVHLPVKSENSANGNKRPSHRGFGFVQFATRMDAAIAIQKANESKICGRTVAIDWALGQRQYEALLHAMEKQEQQEHEESNEEDADKQVNDPQPSDEDSTENMANQTTMVTNIEKDEIEDNNDVNDTISDASENETDTETIEDDEDEEDDVENDQENDDRKKMSTESTKQSHTGDVHKGTTLFIRNIPFDATQDDLHRCFRRFGKLRYARLVIDGASGMARGSGFVQYLERSDADAALKKANGGHLPAGDQYNEESDTSDKNSEQDELDVVPMPPAGVIASNASAASGMTKNKNSNSMGSGQLHHVPASVAAALTEGGIQLKERTLLVSRAVDRNEANQLTSNIKDALKKFEKRHLYLAREGHIAGGTDAAKEMPSLDLQKRESAAREKNARLKNPLFFVSPTRLSIRNLHKSIDDKQLKQAVRDAALFGLQQGVVAPNEGDPYLWPAPGTRVSTMRPSIVKVIVMRENPRKEGERVRFEADGKTLRSKGFAFVEFEQHFAALAALRVLNNNPEYSFLAVGGRGSMKRSEVDRPRLIVEFTIENIAKLKVRERRLANAEKRRLQILAERGLTPSTNDTATSTQEKVTSQTEETTQSESDASKSVQDEIEQVSDLVEDDEDEVDYEDQDNNMSENESEDDLDAILEQTSRDNTNTTSINDVLMEDESMEGSDGSDSDSVSVVEFDGTGKVLQGEMSDEYEEEEDDDDDDDEIDSTQFGFDLTHLMAEFDKKHGAQFTSENDTRAKKPISRADAIQSAVAAGKAASVSQTKSNKQNQKQKQSQKQKQKQKQNQKNIPKMKRTSAATNQRKRSQPPKRQRRQ